MELVEAWKPPACCRHKHRLRSAFASGELTAPLLITEGTSAEADGLREGLAWANGARAPRRLDCMRLACSVAVCRVGCAQSTPLQDVDGQ